MSEPTEEPFMIADERDHFQAAMHRMRDTFVEACELVGDWKKQGELQREFFDGYQDVKRLFGTTLLMKEIFGGRDGS